MQLLSISETVLSLWLLLVIYYSIRSGFQLEAKNTNQPLSGYKKLDIGLNHCPPFVYINGPLLT